MGSDRSDDRGDRRERDRGHEPLTHADLREIRLMLRDIQHLQSYFLQELTMVGPKLNELIALSTEMRDVTVPALAQAFDVLGQAVAVEVVQINEKIGSIETQNDEALTPALEALTPTRDRLQALSNAANTMRETIANIIPDVLPPNPETPPAEGGAASLQSKSRRANA